ncbi:hypothetical protein ACHAXS_011479, partial [Conticribra weissflogii]
ARRSSCNRVLTAASSLSFDGKVKLHTLAESRLITWVNWFSTELTNLEKSIRSLLIKTNLDRMQSQTANTSGSDVPSYVKMISSWRRL